MLLLVVSLYNCYMIPLRLAFAKPLQYSLWIYAADYSLDLIIIADVIMRSRIFGFLVDGQLQTEPRLILKNFHNKWVLTFACIPWDAFALIGFGLHPSLLPLVLACLRTPKILLMGEFFTRFQLLERSFEDWHLFVKVRDP